MRGIETRRYRFDILTPLHIGSGESVTRADYVRLGSTIAVVNPDKLAYLLKDEGLVADFISMFSAQKDRFSLNEFLRTYRLLDPETIRSFTDYTLHVIDSPDDKISGFIRGIDSQPFVPGSSIKGALRVAFLYNLLKSNEHLRMKLLEDPVRKMMEGYENRLKEISRLKEKREIIREKRRLKRELKRQADRITKGIENLLNGFKFPSKSGRPNSPNTDIMRVLRVKDSAYMPASSLSLIRVDVVRAKTGKKVVTAFVEALMPGATFEVEMEIDHDLMDYFRRNNRRSHYNIPFEGYERLIKDPFAASREMIEDFFRHEKESIKDSALMSKLSAVETGAPNFRFGWGQGILSTSLFMLLPEDLRRKVRNAFHKDVGDVEAPLTRKVHRGTMLGFCRVEEIQDARW